MNVLPNVEESYTVEVMRKAIHLSSLSIPIVYFFVDRFVALSVLLPLTLAFTLSDVLRLYHKPTGRVYERYLGFLLRRHERNDHGRRLNGATYVLLSASICVLFFPKVIVVTAFAILIVSDSAAALIGRRFGRHRFFGKSFEGAGAFFFTAVVVVFIAPKVLYIPAEYLIGIGGALFGAIVESSPLPVDDNLSIPIAIGAIMWGCYALFLPAVNVFALG
ncbi:MAG: diacylglycerol/polyprenol kinase family protein [Bacteroidota bacterium]